MPVTKLEAAQRQLDCAIRLYITEDDALSVHTLSRAAFRLLYDIYPTLRNDGFTRDTTSKWIEQLGWKNFNEAANFLKHANSDPEATHDVNEGDTQMGIGFAIILYQRLSGGHTPEMRAFDEWMKITNPDKFKIMPDPDPTFEREYRESVEIINAAPKAQRLLLAQALLKFFREHPEGGNAWRKVLK